MIRPRMSWPTIVWNPEMPKSPEPFFDPDDARIASLPGLKARYRVLTDGDFQERAWRSGSSVAFVEALIDPASPQAAAGRAVLEQFFAEAMAAPGRPAGPDQVKYAIPYLGELIAGRLGATGYRRVREVPWGTEMMFGPDCYMLTVPDAGRVFLDADQVRGEIWLSQISVEHRGGGLGTRVMEAIREIALERGCGVQVFKVTNPSFFRRFAWLEDVGWQNFRGAPERIRTASVTAAAEADTDPDEDGPAP